MGWFTCSTLLCLLSGAIEIDAKFPGGNIVVDGIDDQVVRLRTDLRDTAGWWFYWNFRVQGAEGKNVRFVFDTEPVGVRGPAVSVDAGRTWRYLGAAGGDTRSFRYQFQPDEQDVRFAYAIPYLQADWERFLDAYKGSPRLRSAVLCKSRQGRDVECLYFGRLDPPGAPGRGGKPVARAMFTCRHHACESLASYVLEGLVAAVVDATSEEGRWLGENVALLCVPFVDKDGVEAGDQGKNRKPHDHNRDYSGEGLYPETRGIRTQVPQWLAEGPAVLVDLHCPCIRGEHDTRIYMVGSPIERIAVEQKRFYEILKGGLRGPLPYGEKGLLASGTGWNKPGSYKAGDPFSHWASKLPVARLAGTFEIPYAQAGGVEVNAQSARAFGRDLARALYEYLRPLGTQP